MKIDLELFAGSLIATGGWSAALAGGGVALGLGSAAVHTEEALDLAVMADTHLEPGQALVSEQIASEARFWATVEDVTLLLGPAVEALPSSSELRAARELVEATARRWQATARRWQAAGSELVDAPVPGLALAEGPGGIPHRSVDPVSARPRDEAHLALLSERPPPEPGPVVDEAAVPGRAVDGGGAGACFVAGTQVATVSGFAAIETLRVGDRVLAFAGSAGSTDGGQVSARSPRGEGGGDVLATVTHTFVRTVDAVIAVGVAYPDGAVDTLVGTPNHPFWVPAEGRYVALEELAVGAVLRTVGGGEARVAGKAWRRGEVEVFDVEVEGLHCFYVARAADAGVPGVLVHNSTKLDDGSPRVRTVHGVDEAAERAYEAIRASTGDVDAIARHTGLSSEVIARTKENMFLGEHVIARGVGEAPVVARFSANSEWARLWHRAESGTLTREELKAFSDLVTHENVEARLLEKGMTLYEPFEYVDGDLWRPFRARTAHDLAGVAEKGFSPRLVSQIPEAIREDVLQDMVRTYYEVHGKVGPDVLSAWHPDAVRAYRRLLGGG